MFGDKPKQLVFIGSDHAGFKVKADVYKHLLDGGYAVTDLGTFTEEPCDYPDIAREVGEKVKEHAGCFGVLICGTGIGMSMAANKLRGIRAAMVTDENMAEMSRKHNNANVLCMGARISTPELITKMTDKFLKTTFDGEDRHARRVLKIDEM
jgi:ribose 5-phosphate isomerase B